MISHRRLLVPAVSSFALLLGAGLPVSAFADAPATVEQTQSASGARPWAHETSDIKPDERLRFGTMPNDMRYVLMRNATPPGLTSLRLHINAGSLNEDDDQKGLAHFTEHMLFNGTENIPETEMLRILERLGLAFGADTNAATSFDQTFYRLDLPRATDEVLDPSLRILREQVSRALFDTAAIDAERDVIVGEERLRNSPALRALKAQINLMAPGQRLSERLPIGDLDIIRTAPAQRFIDFYRAYYRPERTTFVAVGDFDVATMEAKVRAAFEDWTNTHPAGPDPDLGTVREREPEAVIHVEPGTQSQIALSWLSPPQNKPDTVANRRERTLRNLAFRVLNRRFGELSRQDDPPFLGASASSSELLRSVNIASTSASFNPGGLERALTTIEQEQRRMVEYGPTMAELQREITDIRTSLENAVTAANTQSTAALASSILSAVNDDEIWSSPQTDLELFNDSVAELNLQEVHQLFNDAMKGTGPVAMVTTPTPIENGEAIVLQTLAASQQVRVDPPAAQATREWPYTDFGTATTPSSQQELSLVKAVQYNFPNNVRLIVKPTDFRADQILVNVRTGIGHQALPSDRFSPLLMLQSVATQGGLGQLTMDELNRVLSGRTYSAGVGLGTEGISLSGQTRPSDLQLQMQVLAAYFTDPAFRPAPLQQLKSVYPEVLKQSRSTPAGVLSLELPAVLTSGDRRNMLPSNEEVQALTADAIKAEAMKALSEGPIDIIMVGDVEIEDAVAAVSNTFGALPTRSAMPSPHPDAKPLTLPGPNPTPYTFTHEGPADQAITQIIFPTTDALGDRREARLVSLLSEVVNLRVLEEIREKQALAYSPGVSDTASSIYKDYGYLAIGGAVEPAKVDAFYAAVQKIVDGFADTPVTEDELIRARNPVIERQQRAMATNSYWLGNLSDLARKPEQEVLVTNYLDTINAFTAEDVQAAARKYLTMDRTIRVNVLPAAAQ